MAHRSNSGLPSLAWLVNQQSGSPKKIMHTTGAKCRSEMMNRLDIHTATDAPHICIVSRGSPLVLWRARVIVSLLVQARMRRVEGGRQPRRTAHIEARGATIESVLGSCGDRWKRYWATCKVEFACTCEHSVYRALVPAVEWTGSTGFCPVCRSWEREGERTRQEGSLYCSPSIACKLKSSWMVDLSH